MDAECFSCEVDMRRSLIAGLVLAVFAALIIGLGELFGLDLQHVALMGAAIGGVLGLVPHQHSLGKLGGFAIGFAVAWVGFALRAALLPDSAAGRAAAAFIVVAAPESAAMREASYFVERLAEEQMPLAGLVINRVHDNGADGISAADAESGGHKLQVGSATDQVTEDLLAVHAERMRVSARETRLRKQFTAAHPGVATVSVAALASDVHDLDGLREIGGLLGETS